MQNIRKIPFQIMVNNVEGEFSTLVEKLCTRCEHLCASLPVFAHFSLACHVPIRDNPALSNSDLEVACTHGRVGRQDIRGTAAHSNEG